MNNTPVKDNKAARDTLIKLIKYRADRPTKIFVVSPVSEIDKRGIQFLEFDTADFDHVRRTAIDCARFIFGTETLICPIEIQ